MTAVPAFLATVAAKGVELWAEGDRLRVRGPREALDETLMAMLKARKSELLAALQGSEAMPGLPLSQAQQTIWNAWRAAPDSAAYNVNMALALRADVDVEALQRALNVVVDRHLGLRCRFRLGNDGEPAQFPDPSPRLTLQRQTVAAPALEAAIDAEIDRPFDLTQSLPLRATLFERAAEAPVLVLVVHHIAADFWAAGIVLDELAAAYAAELGGTPLPPPAELDLRAFVAAERERLATPEAERDLSWFGPLLDDQATLQLPADRSRRKQRRFVGRSLEQPLPADLTQALRNLARAQRVTPYALMLALFSALLARLGGGRRLRLGLPTAGRELAGSEGLVANLVNLLPFVAEPEADTSFAELLLDTRRRLNDVLARQQVPYDALLRRYGRRRDGGGSPFFDVLFNWNKVAADTQSDHRLVSAFLRGSSTGRSGATHELALSVVEQGDALACRWTFDEDVFDVETVQGWAEAYRQLLQALVAAPQRRPGSVDLLDAGGQQHALAAMRGDAAPRETLSVAERIARLAQSQPAAPAVADDDEALDFAELQRRSDRLARRLRARGIGIDDRVVVCLPRSVDLVAACLAVQQTGAAFVPLDPALPSARVAAIAGDCAARCLIATAEHTVSGVESLPVRGSEADVDADCAADVAAAAHPDALAYVIYTSGSTGAPKGVMVTQADLAHLADWHRARYGTGPGTVGSQMASPGFDASVLEIWPVLAAGGSLRIVPQAVIERPAALPGFFARHRISWTFMAPALFESVPAEQWAAVDSLHWLAVGGDRLRGRLPAGRVRLDNLYGPTEVTVLASAGEPSGQGLPDIGRPIGNADVLVCDQDDALLPIGSAGQLLLATPGLARGYLADPRRTAERFRPHPFPRQAGERIYHSGDLGRLRADGRLEFLGRVDRQLKLRGYRIEPGEIEQALLAAADVEAAEVLCLGSDEQPRLVAFCAGTADPQALREVLRGRLPGYMVPAQIRVLAQLPLTASGKVDRRALETLADDDTRVVVAPRSDRERALLAIWQEVLGVEAIGVEDDFFAIGGHSLLAAQLVERVRQRMHRELSLAEVLAHPTVREQASLIDAAGPAHDEALPCIAPDAARRHEPFPLTDVQHAYWAGRGAGFELGNTATHIYTEQARDRFDAEAVNRIWNALIRRHDMLRVVVGADGMQRILPDVPEYRIEVDDLRALGADERERRLLATRERMSHQVFDPARWPLFEIRVSRIADDHFRLHSSIDALMADAQSFALLEGEYALLAAGREQELPALTLSFRDYVLAEREARSGGRYERARDYWLARLADFPAAPALPLACDPSEIDKPVFRRWAGRVPAERWQRLKAQARVLRATPSTLLVTAYAEVLAAFARDRRFALNLTLFNRQPWHPEVDRLLGDFTSLTMLEVAARDPASFAERVVRCQRQLWQDLEHRAFTGVELLRELARRSGLRQAGMPVVFTSILPLDADADAAVDAPRQAPDFAITQTSQVWIDHVVEEHDGALVFHWDVVEALFPDGLIDAMFASYLQLLDSLVDQPDSWQLAQPLSLPAGQRQARETYNDTATIVPEGLLYGPFLQRVASQPDAPALVTDELQFDYRSLHALAVAHARLLVDAGVRPNQLVAIEMRKGWQQVVAALAVTLAGAAYLPVDAHLPPSRRQQLFEQGGVVLALVAEHAEGDHSPAVERLVVRRDRSAAQDFVPPPIAADTLAYVIFTSGSTGVPKGVMIDHRGALNTVVDINRRFAVEPGDRLLGLSSLSFDLSVYDVFGVLAAGATLVLPDDDAVRNPEAWGAALQRHRVTLFNGVPSFMQMLADYVDGGGAALDAPLRLAMMSGDWIPLPLPSRIRQIFPHCRVVSLGGATEASIWSIWHDIDAVDARWRSIPYGRPLDNQQIHVLHDDFSPCPDWVPGDLYIGGIGLALGYWQDPERTAASFVHHPVTGERLYRTGDLGRFTADGWVEFLGRADTQVKVQGHRIELAEIEAHLGQHPAVRECVVDARGDGPARALYGYVVPVRAGLKEAVTESRSAVDFAPEHAEGRPDGGTVLSDPVDRILFKFARHGLRRLPADSERLALPDAGAPLRLDLAPPVFAGALSDLSALADLLAALRARPQPGSPLPKLQYPSAGSLYPVQVHVRIGRDSGLPAGCWYYHPDEHALLRTGAPVDGADVELLLVAELQAIEPLYGSLGGDFCELEAGYIEALLAARAATLDVGWQLTEADASSAEGLALGRSQRVLRVLRIGTPDWPQPLPACEVGLRLPAQSLPLPFEPLPLARQSYREFLGAAIAQTRLARLLQVIEARRATPWLYVQPGRIDGLDGGLYRLAADGRGLDPAGAADPGLAGAFTGDNRALFDGAAFALLLTADTRDAEALFEAGRLGSRLSLMAADDEIGLCGIGHLRESVLHAACPAMNGQVLLHALVGGAIAPEQKTRWQVVARPDAEQALARQLDGWLRERLPEYMVPRGFVVLDALPLGPNGKVDRRALPTPSADRQVASAALDEPQGELERTIAEVWRDLLGVEQIGRRQNFFELGGNSVLIVQMYGRLSALIAAEFSVADLFAHVTVAALAAHLSGAATATTTADSDQRAARRRQATAGRRRVAAPGATEA